MRDRQGHREEETERDSGRDTEKVKERDTKRETEKEVCHSVTTSQDDGYQVAATRLNQPNYCFTLY
jgi:hypothetical protein